MAEYRLSSQLYGHDGSVGSICICGDAGIATASRDRTIRFWRHTPRGYLLYKTLAGGHVGFVGPLAWVPKSDQFPEGALVSGGTDTLVLLWDLHRTQVFWRMEGHTGEVTGLAIDNNDVISSSLDCTLRRWRNGIVVDVWEAHKAAVQTFLKLPSGELITGSSDSTIKHWREKTCVQTFSGDPGTIFRCLAYLPGLGILYASREGTIKLWSLNTQAPTTKPTLEMIGHSSLVYSLDVHSSGRIASGSQDNSVRIWKDGICLRSVQILEHPGCIWDAKFLENGDVVTACSDRIVRIWTTDPNRSCTDKEFAAYTDLVSRCNPSTTKSILKWKLNLQKVPEKSPLRKLTVIEELEWIERSTTRKRKERLYDSTSLTFLKLGDNYPAPRQIKGKVSGIKEVAMIKCEPKKFGQDQKQLICYEGEVKFGDITSYTIKASLLSFELSHGGMEAIKDVHGKLLLFNHPYIVKSLGYTYGVGVHEGYIFLVLPYFKRTFDDYKENKSSCVNLGRFTEEFIEVMGCVVRGLIHGHNNGMYCPKLDGQHILIMEENNLVTAQLWSFATCKPGNESRQKLKNWGALGALLRKIAKRHQSFGAEIEDLCKRMIEGTLIGMNCLKHSALLSVRVKFEKILAFNMHVLAHFDKFGKIKKSTAFTENQPEDSFISILKSLLIEKSEWKKYVPDWIEMRLEGMGYSLPKVGTFQSFVWFLRCLIEHEILYKPAEATRRISSNTYQFADEQPDLECEIRRAWPEYYLKVLNLALQFDVGYE